MALLASAQMYWVRHRPARVHVPQILSSWAQSVIASDPSEDRRKIFSDCGTKVCDDNGEAASAADIIILAVKPQIINEVVKSLADKVGPDTLVISIAAGVSCLKLEKLLPENTHLVRVMPNPVRNTGQVAFSAKIRSRGEVTIYDTTGRLIWKRGLDIAEPGRHQVTWPGTDTGGRSVASGVYFVEVTTGDTQSRTKIVVLR